MYVRNVPGVMVPEITLWPPSWITIALTTPISTAAERLISDVAVSVFSTFSSKRRTPPANTFSSRASAWYPFTTRTPPSDSVSRPVTSALILDRVRKIGRIVAKALFSPTPKTRRTPKATAVIITLVCSRYPSAISAVISPPANSTRPVPMRFRTPSTSLMIRDTRAPVLFAS